jgi:hypothetical protein
VAADARDRLASDGTAVSGWVDVDPVELASGLAVFLVIGVIRPRWTTPAIAVAARRLVGGPGGGPPARRRWG